MSRMFKDDNHCFACGDLNPEGLHMQVTRDNGTAQAEVTLRQTHQGWQDIAHGGMVSTILDEIMAHAIVEREPQAATVEMKIRFSQKVPLEVPLFTKGWIVEQKRRLIITKSELRRKDNDQLLARAEAKFMLPPPSK